MRVRVVSHPRGPLAEALSRTLTLRVVTPARTVRRSSRVTRPTPRSSTKLWGVIAMETVWLASGVRKRRREND